MAKKSSALQKEWRERDLQRIRNLTAGNYNSTTVTQSGYKKQIIERNEGEIFTEEGKEYIIQKGIKVRNSPLKDIRKTTIIPLFCPCCDKPLTHELSKKMFRLKGMCLDCNILVESKMKQDGTYAAYKEQMLSSNYKAELISLREYIIDYMKMEKKIVNSQGDVEEWSEGNVNTDAVIQAIDEELETL